MFALSLLAVYRAVELASVHRHLCSVVRAFKKAIQQEEYVSFLASVRASIEGRVPSLASLATLQGPFPALFYIAEALCSGPCLWPRPQTNSGVGMQRSLPLECSPWASDIDLAFYPCLDRDGPGL